MHRTRLKYNGSNSIIIIYNSWSLMTFLGYDIDVQFQISNKIVLRIMWTFPKSIYIKNKNLLKLRYLWTLPGKKPYMMSSSFSNTTPMSNFKSISLAVIEFWKRYHHQKPLIHKDSEVETWPKSCLILNVFFSIVNKAALNGPHTPFSRNLFFQGFLRVLTKMGNPQLLKSCIQLWICSNIISKIYGFLEKIRNFSEKFINTRSCLLSHQKIPSFFTPQSRSTLLFLHSLLSTWIHFCTSLEVILLATKALIAAWLSEWK